MDRQSEKCIMVIDEELPLGIIANARLVMASVSYQSSYSVTPTPLLLSPDPFGIFGPSDVWLCGFPRCQK